MGPKTIFEKLSDDNFQFFRYFSTRVGISVKVVMYSIRVFTVVSNNYAMA